MSQINNKFEDLFSAASFAEDGEPQFAKEIMAASHCLPSKKPPPEHCRKYLPDHNH